MSEQEKPLARRDQPAEWHDYVADKLRAQEERMDAHEVALQANTEATKAAAQATARVEANTAGIVDMLNSWEGAMKTIASIGKFLRPITYIIAFCTAAAGLWAKYRGHE
jgi:hypothetical protein